MWRDAETLQIGVEPGNGVLVAGLDSATASWLVGLDGTRSEAECLADASVLGIGSASAVGMLTGLRTAGVLLHGPIGCQATAESGLLPEFVSLVDPRSPTSTASAVLQERERRHVVIDGANRIGVPLGALLVASGVAGLSFRDPATVRLCDASVGGLSADDEGEARTVAAQRALRRASAAHLTLPVPTTQPDLVILCQPWSAHDPLHVQGPPASAYMSVAVRAGRVVIGPLVLPGRTSCLRCAELHRTDRDARWPAIAAQLSAGPHRAIHQPTHVLAALAAALAAAQVLDFLDGIRRPHVLEATLEVHPPDWQIHRRSWPPHVECGCLDPRIESVAATG